MRKKIEDASAVLLETDLVWDYLGSAKEMNVVLYNAISYAQQAIEKYGKKEPCVEAGSGLPLGSDENWNGAAEPYQFHLFENGESLSKSPFR
ncbi:MAG: hypothetical protein LBC63_04565 [Holophagales bacterium]|jgi:hypothetical protein|nr:hypothetical protein [Holophagales bacterium]